MVVKRYGGLWRNVSMVVVIPGMLASSSRAILGYDLPMGQVNVTKIAIPSCVFGSWLVFTHTMTDEKLTWHQQREFEHPNHEGSTPIYQCGPLGTRRISNAKERANARSS